MQEIEVKIVLNNQEYLSRLQISDRELTELISSAKSVKLGYDTNLAKMKLSEMRAEQARLKTELQEKIKLDVDMASILETKNKLHAIEESLDGVVAKEKEAGSASGGWSLNIMGINQGLDLMKKAWEALSVPIGKAGQFEQYQVSMKVMLGSTQAAQQRLADLIEFAKTTPFELPQVVEAANQLQAIGLYSEETLRNLGDLASASGKPMEQALAAFAKMATGQKGIAVDMFRDLLISVDDWVAATGKGVKATGELEASAEEMLTALPKIIQEKNFAGMMDEQSKTFNGAVSNMQDGMGQLLTAVGEKVLPVAKNIVAGMNGIISSLIPTTTNLDNASKSSSELSSRFNILAFRVETLGKKTNLTDSETKIYKESLDALQKDYPNYFKNINLNAEKYDSVMTAIKGARIELDKYIDSMIKAAVLQDKYDQIKQIGLKIEEATVKKLDVQGKIDTAKKDGSYDKTSYTDSGTGKVIVQTNKKTIYTEDLNRYEKEITNLESEKNKLEKRIEQILSEGQNVTTTPKDEKPKTNDGDGKKPTVPPTTKTKDFYQETLQDIKKASQEEILTEKAKTQTITDLYNQKQSYEKDLLQASINLNKDSNNEKLKSEKETAQENYNVTTKLLEDKLTEERKFQDSKSSIIAKIEQDNQAETMSVRLKNSTIKQLEDQLLQSKIDKSMIEEQIKLTSDANRLDSLEKERAATNEKIQLIQSEIDKKNEQVTQLKEIEIQENENNIAQQTRSLSTLELNTQISNEEQNLSAIKTKLRNAKSQEEQKQLLNEYNQVNERKKMFQSEILARHQLNTSTIENYANQYDASKPFHEQAKQAVRENIKAEISKAVANQIAWVIDLIPFPFNIVAAPLAGLAVGAMMENMIPKFEYGGYPTGKNAIVQVNENGQEFILNSKATKKYSGILEQMNAGIYQPSRERFVPDIYYPVQDNNSGFTMLVDAIQTQTERLEMVERFVKVSELSEGLNNYNKQQSKLGY